jgi:hypothetical protein
LGCGKIDPFQSMLTCCSVRNRYGEERG